MDPLYWCYKGFAVVNYDPRGIGNSEGDASVEGAAEGEDGYDTVEWIAAQEWCTGKVGMGGNSALAMCQWRVAAQQPPHLVCIAPWEGTYDYYRELLAMGGIVESGFNKYLMVDFVGNGYIEEPCKTAEDYPLFNAYWADKAPDFDKIVVPAYVTGGWNHFHLRGVTTAFRKIASKQKWFRIHRDFEWPDLYSRLGVQELTMFFERYLLDIHNGWESTPKVRIDVMDAYNFDFQLLRAEEDWPIPRTEYTKLYLDAKSRSMQYAPPAAASQCHYDANLGKATFDMTFEDETEITGHMALRLWVEAQGNDDMDLFVAVKKLDAQGKWLPLHVLGREHPGAPGKLRMSLRETDPEKSEIFQPYHPYNNPQKLSPGEIVACDIEIWPQSKIFHAGEQIRVEVMGHYEREDWFEPFAWETLNKGVHVIHTGGQYDSYLLAPVIPPKYVAGNTVYR
jgi:putative CocE/NonD family hydrolase